jgi:hypothetical protein
MNITKEFIPYTEALSLKELGFDEPCFGLYHNDKTFYPTQCKSHEQFHGQICSAPLYQQAFRWFREKYEWQHSIEPTADQHSHQLGYNYWIWNYKTGEEYHTMPKNRPSGDWEYKAYEEAELECLKKLIEIVQTY